VPPVGTMVDAARAAPVVTGVGGVGNTEYALGEWVWFQSRRAGHWVLGQVAELVGLFQHDPSNQVCGSNCKSVRLHVGNGVHVIRARNKVRKAEVAT
jgi:hypothetical protein